MQRKRFFPSLLSQNQSITVLVEGLQANMSYQFSSLVQSATGEVMSSTMATYIAGTTTCSQDQSPRLLFVLQFGCIMRQ